MTRRRALFIAGTVTAVVVALAVGVGASFGQFGFAEAEERQAAVGPYVDQGTTVDGQEAAPVDQGYEEDGEWEDDDRYEHEDDGDDDHDEDDEREDDDRWEDEDD